MGVSMTDQKAAKAELQLVVGKAGRKPRPKASREVPLIRVDADLDLIIDECCREIGQHPQIFKRGGKLVTISDDGQIRDLQIPSLREKLCAVGSFVRAKQGAFGQAKVPNDHIVHGVFHRGSWQARELVGVTDAPFMRPDGTIVQTPGFDLSTGFFFQPRSPFPIIKDEPTIDDARGALVDILEPIQEFPFRTIGDRSPSLSAYLALLITLMIRPAIGGVVPGWLISANTRGTGKTFLARIASIITQGDNPEPMIFSKDDDEVRKKITSGLKVGRRFIMFDNVKRAIGGEAIEVALTSPVWGDRDLGTMTSLSLVNNAVFAFTGNNLMTEQDASRRFLPVDLETHHMNPEDRSFRIDDIMGWTQENRPRLVASILTIARAWWAAGKPRMSIRALGGFEHWSYTVPSMLAWVGVTSPLEARTTSTATEDSDRLDLVRLADWWEGFLDFFGARNDGATISGLINFLYPIDKARLTQQLSEFREDLEGILSQTGKHDVARSLSYRLRNTRRRVIDESGRFFDQGKTLKGSPRWLVRRRADDVPTSAVRASEDAP